MYPDPSIVHHLQMLPQDPSGHEGIVNGPKFIRFQCELVCA
jgi:hypothetical protein